MTEQTSWQNLNTAPKGKIILLKTTRGVVSGEYFPPEHHPIDPEASEPAVWSCYDDQITFMCEDWDEDGNEIYPELLGWMEIPQ